MRTTIDIDDALFEEAMAEMQSVIPGITKRACVEAGLQALIERSAQKKLAAAFGAAERTGAASDRRRR